MSDEVNVSGLVAGQSRDSGGRTPKENKAALVERWTRRLTETLAPLTNRGKLIAIWSISKLMEPEDAEALGQAINNLPGFFDAPPPRSDHDNPFPPTFRPDRPPGAFDADALIAMIHYRGDPRMDPATIRIVEAVPDYLKDKRKFVLSIDRDTADRLSSALEEMLNFRPPERDRPEQPICFNWPGALQVRDRFGDLTEDWKLVLEIRTGPRREPYRSR